MEKYFTIIGILVLLVQITIQFIKDLPGLNKIPTSIVTMVLSIIYSELSVVAYAAYSGISVSWYTYVGTFFEGLVVAYVAMYGWEKLKDLWDRCKIQKEE